MVVCAGYSMQQNNNKIDIIGHSQIFLLLPLIMEEQVNRIHSLLYLSRNDSRLTMLAYRTIEGYTAETACNQHHAAQARTYSSLESTYLLTYLEMTTSYLLVLHLQFPILPSRSLCLSLVVLS